LGRHKKPQSSHKECVKCGRDLPIEEFGLQVEVKNGRTYTRRRSECIGCGKKRFVTWSKKFASEHPELVKQYQRKAFLGQYWVDTAEGLVRLTKALFQSMLDSQGGICLICRDDIRGMDAKGRARTMIDHDHARELVTGKKIVRGLLCYRCNIGLGYIEMAIQMLPLMLTYLEDTNTVSNRAVVENVRAMRAFAERYLAKYDAPGAAVSV
jgi:hypothetical protein